MVFSEYMNFKTVKSWPIPCRQARHCWLKARRRKYVIWINIAHREQSTLCTAQRCVLLRLGLIFISKRPHTFNLDTHHAPFWKLKLSNTTSKIVKVRKSQKNFFLVFKYSKNKQNVLQISGLAMWWNQKNKRLVIEIICFLKYLKTRKKFLWDFPDL